MKRATTIITGIIALIVLGLIVWYGQKNDSPTNNVSSDTESAIRSNVTEFGSRLKNVSLLASDAGDQIGSNYQEFITPELLAEWQANPTEALGRKTSSPWPDRIEITSITRESSRTYKVEGGVIEVTSANAANNPSAIMPVTFLVEEQNGTWVIGSVEKGDYTTLPERVTIDGEWECLPHRDTSGPQTMECAFGIESNGIHYALNLQLLSVTPIDYPTGTQVRVEGILVPEENLSTDMWKKYAIEGVISVTSINEI